MKRTIQTTRYFAILGITLLIFIIGIFIGSSIETQRVNFIVDELQEQITSNQNLIAEQNFIEFLLTEKDLTPESCTQIETAYKVSLSNLDKAISKLEEYETSATTNEDAYERIKQQYAQTQLAYWTLGKQLKTACNIKYETILYFYEDADTCLECDDQGLYLRYVKQKLGEEIGVFSFDKNYEGPISLLKLHYNITQRETPILVIMDNVYPFSTHDSIFEILCGGDAVIRNLDCGKTKSTLSVTNSSS